MRLSWLVLVVSAAFAGEAHAKRISCTCPGRVVVPEHGAVNVPTNAKIWILDPHGARSVQPTLVANSEYRNATEGVVFTTSGERDDTPPAAPRDVFVSMITNEQGAAVAVASMTLFGHYDSDTALVRVEITDRERSIALVTTPKRLYLCEPGIRVKPGSVGVKIIAIDVAGNASPAFETRVDVSYVRERDLDTSCEDHYPYRGHGFEILVGLFGYVLFLLGWVVFLLARNASAKRHPPEEISRLVAEGVTRRMLRWYVVWMAMLVISAIGLNVAGSPIVAFFLSPFVLAALLRLHHARRIHRMLEHPEAIATRRDIWLFVQTPSDISKLRASSADFVQAKRAGVPTSIVQ